MKRLESKTALINGLLSQFIKDHKLSPDYIETALTWFIPLANKISLHQSSANRPILIGVNGCQGSGKSTLTALLTILLNEVFDKSTIGFSIDDFYLSKQQRNGLSKSIHPLFKTRGAPGTHDLGLLEKSIARLLAGKNVTLPVFNKAIDDLEPMSNWVQVHKSHKIIILEGWCVGIDSQEQHELVEPANELEARLDKDSIWRQHVNDLLSVDYKHVFSLIDFLIMLKAPSFEQVYKWRCEQEHKLIASLAAEGNLSKNRATMSDPQILTFIQFYQRLTQHALETMPAKSNCLFKLDSNRSIEACINS